MSNSEGPAPNVAFESNKEIAIHVPNLEEARAFYQGVLGFRVVDANDDSLELDTGALRLYVNRDKDHVRSYIPSFDVPDLAAARDHLVRGGCDTVPLASGGMYFKDPFGLVFDIIQR